MADKLNVTFGEVPTGRGDRVILYGPGGIGKTTLGATAAGPVAFIDLDESLSKLTVGFKDHGLDVRFVPVATWADLRTALICGGWREIKTIVIDSISRAEELCAAWVIEHVMHEKQHKVERLEDYGYGKGYQHVYETFIGLLPILDDHVRAGRNVILICHDCTTPVPNPQGEDWIRYEPRLQTSSTGKSSIRLRVREWADHVLFIGYDVTVTKDGKGRGFGSRTIYPTELPHCMAKSRTLADSIPLKHWDRTLWEKLAGTRQTKLDEPAKSEAPKAEAPKPPPASDAEDERGELLCEVAALVQKYKITQAVQDGWLKHYKVTKADELPNGKLRNIVKRIREKYGKEKTQ